MKHSLNALVLILLMFTFLGVGCTPTDSPGDDLSEETDDESDEAAGLDEEELPDNPEPSDLTSHGSYIDFTGIDEAVTGNWSLVSITVAGQPMNFYGHGLFLTGGGFSTDYSTEQYSGPMVPEGLCYFEGGTSGTHYETTDIDLDLSVDTNDDGQISEDELVIFNTIEFSGGGSITSTCSAWQTVVTSVSNISLGTGPANAANLAGGVSYTYTMDASWNMLSITAEHVPVTYLYQRQ